jgi:hypothetical protein
VRRNGKEIVALTDCVAQFLDEWVARVRAVCSGCAATLSGWASDSEDSCLELPLWFLAIAHLRPNKSKFEIKDNANEVCRGERCTGEQYLRRDDKESGVGKRDNILHLRTMFLQATTNRRARRAPNS